MERNFVFEICEEIVKWSNKFVVENLYKNMSWSPRKSQQVVFCQEFLIDIVHLTVLSLHPVLGTHS